MSVPEIPLADTDRIRRHVAAEYGLKIRENAPVLAAIALAMMATREVIAEERSKRADDNLLAYKDVRAVLDEVRDDAIVATQDLSAVAVTQIAEKVIDQMEEERHSRMAVVVRLKLGLAVFIGGLAAMFLTNLGVL